MQRRGRKNFSRDGFLQGREREEQDISEAVTATRLIHEVEHTFVRYT